MDCSLAPSPGSDGDWSAHVPFGTIRFKSPGTKFLKLMPVRLTAIWVVGCWPTTEEVGRVVFDKTGGVAA